MTIATTVSNFLTDKGVQYDVISHPEGFTSAETAAAAHVPADHIAKGVVLKDTNGYLLVVIPANKWVNTDRVRDELGRELHMAQEVEIKKLFADCHPGAVPPLGVPYNIDTVMDESLTSLAKVYLEAGSHEELIAVDQEQFQSVMKGVRHGHFTQSD